MTRFQRRSRRATGLAIAGALVAGGLGLSASASAADAADTPPWQQAGSKVNDPNSVGTLAFYDASGAQIFGGSTTAKPFAAFAAGSQVLSGSDTGAALYAYLPDPKTNEGGWSGELLTGASAYPNAKAPGALASTTPLETGTSADTSLADFVSAFPNKSTTTGYSNVYELRLRTSGPGNTGSTTYDAADVEVTGSTWRVVYPQVLTDTSTSLAIAPSTGLKVGGKTTLTATVDSSGAAATTASGTVTFSEGGTSLGSATVTNGVASKSVTIPHAGSATFKATYVPDGSSAFASSSGTATATVAKASTKTTAAWPGGTQHYGTKFSVKAVVAATGATPTGTVTVKSGSKTVASGKLSGGKATVTVSGTALKPGKAKLTVSYAGSSDVSGSTSAAKTITVAKAKSKTADSVSPSKIAKTKRAKVSVKVTAKGVTASGAVTVFDGSKKIAKGSLKKGKASITLPTLKVGKHKLHAVFAGSKTVAGSSGKTVTLTVTS